MGKAIYLACALILLFPLGAFPQDEIILSNGDIIKAKVEEVGISEVKYKKWDNLEGPTYSTAKKEVFMIKYENGNKDIFPKSSPSEKAEATPGQPVVATGPPAEIFFIRPKKLAGSSPEIIVGTIMPDEVVVKVRNGRWYKAMYLNFGEIEFVAGVYSINPEVFRYKIDPGKTYYIFCTIKNKGFKVMAELKMLDESTAKREMNGLKEQLKAK
ncbi:MAG: hypothetical protein M9954_02015 [Cyclobacteriaceae bacterium]|nr:hypothetical protein [Cyclobacteriaceae bacterium]MCB9238700.1 hypothetical protein [Flammeovirgaceae bacterium]MCB0497976.1 hypothetical protein [Cyclobacteriaceae bacterium]MCO5270418.1 hypothetical protein [Cyclobacteriaceae bacterium]MCW5901140.1 hypothetical protein [Cyclobacteriaceae bacterium]